MPFDDSDYYSAVDIRSSVATNPHCPPEVLENLAADEDARVLAALALNPSIPEWIMDDCAESLGFIVESLCLNPSLPSRLFDTIARSGSYEARESLAERTDLPFDLLVQISEDSVDSVRAKITWGKNSPASLRAKVKASLNRDSVEEAFRGVATPATVEGLSKEEREVLAASSEALEEPTQRILSADNNSSVRLRIAMRFDVSREILAALATDSDTDVRITVAKNPNTPHESLEKLAEDALDAVRAAVAGNKNAWEIKETLKTDASAAVRAGDASNPLVDAATLRVLSEDSFAEVLVEVAGNPRTPVDVLATLADFFD